MLFEDYVGVEVRGFKQENISACSQLYWADQPKDHVKCPLGSEVFQMYAPINTNR